MGLDLKGVLIAIEVLVFAVSFLYIFKRDRLVGLYILFLFLYAIVPQLGYAYMSELSVLTKAYFGEGPWYIATNLIIVSFVFILIGFGLFWNTLTKRTPFKLIVIKNKWRFFGDLALLTLLLLFGFELYYFTFNYSNIDWYSGQEQDIGSSDVAYTVFLMTFKSLVSINIVLYCLVCERTGVHPRSVYKLFLSFSVALFMLIAFKLGNRTDILALSLGVLTYHLYKTKVTIKLISRIAIVALAVAGLLVIVESTRYRDGGNDYDLGFIGSLMMKDYYAPAHMLFAAINFNMIDPIEVLFSNISNSLILINYPYLQMGITDAFNPGVATRSAGYAFYILTEGYLAMGPFGFIYNSVIILLGLSLWRKFGLSNSQSFNNFVLALMGCMIVNLVRGQGSYFIKYLYTFVIPAALLYLALTSQSLRIKYSTTARNVGR